MTRDERLLFSLHGGLSFADSVRCRWELLVSPSARDRRRRMAAVSGVLRSALSQPDEFVVVRFGDRSTVWKWVLLAALVGVVVFEYRGYTVPVLSQFVREILRKCGL